MSHPENKKRHPKILRNDELPMQVYTQVFRDNHTTKRTLT